MSVAEAVANIMTRLWNLTLSCARFFVSQACQTVSLRAVLSALMAFTFCTISTVSAAGRGKAVQNCTHPVCAILNSQGMGIRRTLDVRNGGESNPMTIRPLHDRVLIRRIEETETVRGGIIIPDTAKEKSQEGEVMAVGAGKTLENGSVSPMAVKEGDRILFGKYSGSEIRLEALDYLILREDEIMGILTPAGKTARGK